MKVIVGISIGGFFGAAFRYLTAQTLTAGGFSHLNILTVNIIGAFLLAFLFAFGPYSSRLGKSVELGLKVGFCGAFTTFSAFCFDAVTVFLQNGILAMTCYLLIGTALPLVAVIFGFIIGKYFNETDYKGD